MKLSKQQKIDTHNYEYWLKTNTQRQRRRRRTRAVTSSNVIALMAVQAALGISL